jgi:Na+/H+ antiporter NhaD/arsenite permease-like protein
MAVAALESLVYGSVMIDGQEVQVGTLRYMAEMLNNSIPNLSVVVALLGVLSAVIDNVPLVAASMGMYNFPMDHSVWHLIAYAAGTGGSMLIIGSAAGVAAMGMEKIDFIWYLKKITWLAALGFIVGFFLLLFMESL